jgi:NAD(P)-dependent dehydrogenase (short-subunit alcohol dehydrogenase family)
MAKREVALIVGAGPGLGAALARAARAEGMAVAVSSRNATKLDAVARSVDATAFPADASDPASVARLFEAVEAAMGAPDLVVFNASGYGRGSALEIEPAVFESAWRAGCYGGFLVGRAAATAMLKRGTGSILFTGATASLRGGARFVGFAAAKFGLRAVAQSLARDLGPKGIHVAHVVIDGQIKADREGYRESERGADAVMDADGIARTYLALHRQHRSAWAHEIDLRPWVEKF